MKSLIVRQKGHLLMLGRVSGRVYPRKWLLKLGSSDKFATTHIWASSRGIPLCKWPLIQTNCIMITSKLFKARYHICNFCNFSYYLIITGYYIKENNLKRKKLCSILLKKKKNTEVSSIWRLPVFQKESQALWFQDYFHVFKIDARKLKLWDFLPAFPCLLVCWECCGIHNNPVICITSESKTTITAFCCQCVKAEKSTWGEKHTTTGTERKR